MSAAVDMNRRQVTTVSNTKSEGVRAFKAVANDISTHWLKAVGTEAAALREAKGYTQADYHKKYGGELKMSLETMRAVEQGRTSNMHTVLRYLIHLGAKDRLNEVFWQAGRTVHLKLAPPQYPE